MAQKKVSKDPFSEFLSVFEKQRKEMEKLAKPILEYQRKLFEQSKKFHEALTQNVVETIGEVLNQMIEEQRKQTEEANKLLSEMSLPKQVTEYLQNLHKIQERWIEQLKKGTEMIEGFVS